MPPDMFVSAVAVAAASLCPIPDPVFEHSALKSVWTRCTDILKHYKPQVEAATTAIYILEVLGQRIESIREHGKPFFNYHLLCTMLHSVGQPHSGNGNPRLQISCFALPCPALPRTELMSFCFSSPGSQACRQL